MKRMKKMKKFVSLLLTAIMVFAMAAPVFAEPEPNDTKKELIVTSPVSGHTYTAYQIFKGEEVTGEENNYTLSTIDWGNGVDSPALLSALASSTNEKLTGKFVVGMTGRSAAETIATNFKQAADLDVLTKVIALHLTENGIRLTGDTNAVLASVDPGYYIIIDTVDDPNNKAEAVSKYMVEVVGPSTIVTPKTGNTDVEKVVEGKKEITAAIGEPRTFQLIATLPENYADYDVFYLKFNDTMKHLEFIESGDDAFDKDAQTVDGIKIEVGTPTYKEVNGEKVFVFDENTKLLKFNGDPVELVNHKAPVWNAEGKTLTVEIPDVKKGGEGNRDIGAKGKVVVVTYNAKLTDDAVVVSGTDDSNINKVSLDFSNDPNWRPENHPGHENDRPTGQAPEKEVEVLTPQLVISKKDGADEKALSGAEFKLTPSDTTPMYKVMSEKVESFEESADGEYWKLKDGTFTKVDPNTDGIDKEAYESTETKYKLTITERKNLVVDTDGEKSVTAEVSSVDGKIIFTGLAVGTYELEETKAPTGYNKVLGKMTINISYSNGKFTVTATRSSDDVDNAVTINVESNGNKHELSIDFLNNKGAVLPETGGIGTTIFYVLGSILALGAGIVLITKRRMNAEQ